MRELDIALGQMRTTTLLFVTITNNLLGRVLLPGGKTFFCCYLREMPAAILKEKGAAGLVGLFS